MHRRRNFLKKTAAVFSGILLFGVKSQGRQKLSSKNHSEPTQCDFAPPGEYIKDHSIVFHDGHYHLFSISGTQGYYHGYNGNEETISWSISTDLVNWDFRGHVLHASQRRNTFDQHEIWAPFCVKANGKFYMFYTGVVHPIRPMEYRKLGHDHPGVFKGHHESQGLAISNDLTDWEKISDPERGMNIPGRDSNVTYDAHQKRWLLFSTIGVKEVHVSESADLISWKPLGLCAKFADVDAKKDFGSTVKGFNSNFLNPSESLTVMRHPITDQWIMLGNWQYILSDNPEKFNGANATEYNRDYKGKNVDLGFAGEMVQHNGKWYRSGVIGKRDYWRLGFTEVEWTKGGAFNVVKPSLIYK